MVQQGSDDEVEGRAETRQSSKPSAASPAQLQSSHTSSKPSAASPAQLKSSSKQPTFLGKRGAGSAMKADAGEPAADPGVGKGGKVGKGGGGGHQE